MARVTKPRVGWYTIACDYNQLRHPAVLCDNEAEAAQVLRDHEAMEALRGIPYAPGDLIDLKISRGPDGFRWGASLSAVGWATADDVADAVLSLLAAQQDGQGGNDE